MQQQVQNNYLPGQGPKPARKKLTGASQWIVLFLILVFVAAVYVGLYPWGFFLGGNFHLLPCWTGWGKMHSNVAGDYFLYVEIWPSTRALETVVPHTFVVGKGYLCTPRGEHFYLKLSGDMRPRIYLNTVGESIDLDMDNWRASMPVAAQHRPRLSMRGRWGRGEITGDDHQSLSQSFLPDGRVRPQNTYAAPGQLEDIRVTLKEGNHSEWETACRTTTH